MIRGSNGDFENLFVHVFVPKNLQGEFWNRLNGIPAGRNASMDEFTFSEFALAGVETGNGKGRSRGIFNATARHSPTFYLLFSIL